MARDRQRMPMARFLVIAGATATAVFLAVWAYAASHPMHILEADYAVWEAKRDMIEKCPPGAVVVLGDSAPMAGIVSHELAPQVCNFGLPAGGPIEIYFFTQDFLKRGTQPSRIILSISVNDMARTQYYWVQGALYASLGFAQLEEVRRTAAALGDRAFYPWPTSLPLLGMIKNWAYASRFPTITFYGMYRALSARNYARNLAVAKAIEDAGGHHLFGTAPGYYVPNLYAGANELAVDPVIDFYFDRLLALLAAQHLEVVFVAMPINEASYQRLQPNVKAEIAAYLKSRLAKYPAIRLIGELLPYMPNEYFGDKLHLNARGAALFTKNLRTRLE